MNFFVDSLQCYLKRVFLLYADDKVLFAKSIWLSKTVYQKLQDQNRQSCSAALKESPECLNYRVNKTEHTFDKSAT